MNVLKLLTYLSPKLIKALAYLFHATIKNVFYVTKKENL